MTAATSWAKKMQKNIMKLKELSDLEIEVNYVAAITAFIERKSSPT
jgi:uncharacterized protein YaeQ